MSNIVFKPKKCIQYSDHVFAPMDHDNIRCIKCGYRSKAVNLAPLTDPVALLNMEQLFKQEVKDVKENNKESS